MNNARLATDAKTGCCQECGCEWSWHGRGGCVGLLFDCGCTLIVVPTEVAATAPQPTSRP